MLRISLDSITPRILGFLDLTLDGSRRRRHAGIEQLVGDVVQQPFFVVTLFCMDESTSRAVGARASSMKRLADLRLVLGMSRNGTEIRFPVRELTLTTISTRPRLQPRSAQLRLVQWMHDRQNSTSRGGTQ